jgi:hypothetical protein
VKRVRDIGTGLFLVAWIAALILRYGLPEPSPAFLVAAGIAMIGAAMLIGTSFVRLFKGQVRLRPIKAAKRVPFLFALYFAVWWIWRLVFPDDERDLQLALISGITLAVTLSLYSTAYRKPE